MKTVGGASYEEFLAEEFGPFRGFASIELRMFMRAKRHHDMYTAY